MSKFDTVLRTPPVDTLDEGVVKPKTIRLRGFYGSEEAAVKAGRAALEAQRDWIDAVLEADHDEWQYEVAAKGAGSDVRIVGKGLIAFVPDHTAPTATDGGRNEGDPEDTSDVA
jgi:hypothetical protein